ncbi:MAG: hypothetical protein GY847_24630 [Proteobacteria bacterium]|nr:hypothetical protein [Pseudomonadota bacterium]
MNRELKYRVVAILLIGLCLALLSCDCTSQAEAKVLPLSGNRSYSGAPPVIGHKVAELGRSECLSCHLNGDAEDLDGVKPMKTPHPELTRCVQCHLEKTTDELFRENNFKGSTYEIGISSQPEGPPLIPHPLTMRERCLGCHHEQAEPKQLRTDHPERARCVQCHIPAHQGFPGPRPNIEPIPALGGQLPSWSL